MPPQHDFYVQVFDKARMEDFKFVFNSTRVPVKSPVVSIADLPGLGKTEIYELAVDQITPEQRGRLIAHIAFKFHMDPEEVSRDLDNVGMPVLAKDTVVIINHPIRWLS